MNAKKNFENFFCWNQFPFIKIYLICSSHFRSVASTGNDCFVGDVSFEVESHKDKKNDANDDSDDDGGNHRLVVVVDHVNVVACERLLRFVII